MLIVEGFKLTTLPSNDGEQIYHVVACLCLVIPACPFELVLERGGAWVIVERPRI